MIESILLRTEKKMSELSAWPVLGTVIGISKIAMGTVQTISAIALLIILAPVRLTGRCSQLYSRAFCHLVHGSSNVIAGVVEAIPLIGSIAWLIRMYIGSVTGGSTGNGYSPSNDGLFIGYKNLNAGRALNSEGENRAYLLTL